MSFLNSYLEKSISKSKDKSLSKEFVYFKAIGLPVNAYYNFYKKALVKSMPFEFLAEKLEKKLKSVDRDEKQIINSIQLKLYPNLIKSYLNNDKEVLNALKEKGFTSHAHKLEASNFNPELSKIGNAFVADMHDRGHGNIVLHYDCFGGVKTQFTDFYTSEKKRLYTRWFILCHEAAHPEIKKLEKNHFNLDYLPPELNNDINRNFTSRFPSGDIIRRTHEETFADTYGSIMFLHGLGFSGDAIKHVSSMSLARSYASDKNLKNINRLEKKLSKKGTNIHVAMYDPYIFCSDALKDILSNIDKIKAMSASECAVYARDIASKHTMRIFCEEDKLNNVFKMDDVGIPLYNFMANAAHAKLKNKEEEFLQEFKKTNQGAVHEELFLFLHKNFSKSKNFKNLMESIEPESKMKILSGNTMSNLKFSHTVSSSLLNYIEKIKKDMVFKGILSSFENKYLSKLKSLNINLKQYLKDPVNDLGSTENYSVNDKPASSTLKPAYIPAIASVDAQPISSSNIAKLRKASEKSQNPQNHISKKSSPAI